MSVSIIAERIEDIGSLKEVAEKSGFPLQVLPEFALEPYDAQIVHAPGELEDAFTAAARRSPTARVWVRRP